MGFYKTRPKLVEAFQWTGDNQYELIAFVGDITTEIPKGQQYPGLKIQPKMITFAGDILLLDTLDGICSLSRGDYIVKDEGEYRAVQKNEFEQFYFREP